jgi:hypothetical protein
MSNVQAFLRARAVFKVSVINEGARNRYDVSFPRPTGGVGTATFRDNVPSSFTVYKEGVTYAGTPTASIDKLPPQAFAAAGLNATLTKALRLVSFPSDLFNLREALFPQGSCPICFSCSKLSNHKCISSCLGSTA